MAKKIPLEILGKVVTESVKTETALEYKATAFEMFGEIIKNTPVDTGRARGNWNITTDISRLRNHYFSYCNRTSIKRLG